MGSLIAVQLPDGRLIEYVTDGKGRRIGKMVNGVLVKQWLYRDGLRPKAELDGLGNLVATFIYATKRNTPELVIRGGATYRVVSDQLGSPVLVINTANSSDIPFQATYAAFGPRTLLAGSDDWMPFGFVGGLYDSDTKLTRFGVRDYDPTIGRWVSKDPIRFVGGQTNIYVYVNNDPCNRTDPGGTGNTGDLAKCVYWLKVCEMTCPTEVENPIGAGACLACVFWAVTYQCKDVDIPDDLPPLPPSPPPPPSGCEGTSGQSPAPGSSGQGGSGSGQGGNGPGQGGSNFGQGGGGGI
jgi:RHS repeat-associated protein